MLTVKVGRPQGHVRQGSIKDLLDPFEIRDAIKQPGASPSLFRNDFSSGGSGTYVTCVHTLVTQRGACV